jgi:CRISPR/Cas system CSM-associated protein Csm3 (group 7 of RAMP superfamily)
MMVQVDFSKLENKYIIECKLITLEPLRIGCSNSTNETLSTSPVITDNQGRPFIPGTSLKGVLRSAMERIYCTFGYEYDKKGNLVKNESLFALFGSKENKGKIIVHDSYMDESYNFNVVEEKLHKPEQGRLVKIESTAVGVTFNVRIEIINGNEIDVGNVLLALSELGNHRSGIGAWQSRGYGLVSISEIKVKRLNLDLQEESLDPKVFRECVISSLKEHRGGEKDSFDYECYSNASSEDADGTVVCEFELETIDDFKVKGNEEETVTSNNRAYIPGSVIKGFLRRRGFEDLTSPRDRASSIVVSSAFIDDSDPSVDKNDKIKSGTKLRNYIIFRNMRGSEIKEVIEKLSKENKITGTKKDKNCTVKFTLLKATKFHIDSEGFNLDVTDKLKQ